MSPKRKLAAIGGNGNGNPRTGSYHNEGYIADLSGYRQRSLINPLANPYPRPDFSALCWPKAAGIGISASVRLTPG